MYKIYVNEILNIAIRYKIRNCYSNPLLVFDSYYTVNAGRNYLNDDIVNFIGSCKTVRYRGLVAAMKLCKQFVKKPGDTGGIYHPGKQEIFVNHIDPENEIQYILTSSGYPIGGEYYTNLGQLQITFRRL